MKSKPHSSIQSWRWLLKLALLLIPLSILLIPLTPAPAAAADANQVQAANLLQLPVAQALRLEKMVLEGENVPVNLELERFEVFAPDVQIVVRDGQGHEQIEPRPTTAYFKGQIAGDPQSLVVLSADPAGTLRGIVQQGKRLWILAGGAAAGGPRVGLASREVAQSGGLTGLPPFQCGVEGRMQKLTAPPLPRVNALPIAPLPAGQFYQVPVAIETDGEFYNLFGSSSAATSYIGDLFAYASVIYNREASAKLVVGNITLWSGGADSDPWNHADTEAGLYSFRDYWNANRTGINRAIAHFLSGRSLGGGIAYVGVLCNSTYGYGYSANISKQFQISNPQSVWDIIVVTHEIGHNFSSPHTHCYNGIGGNTNPVDACWSGEGDCWSGTTSLPGVNSLTGGTAGSSNGTIMSYCHQLNGGLSNIALTFGQNHNYGVAANRVSSKIASYVANIAASYPNCISIGSSGSTYALTLAKEGTGNGTVSGGGNYAAGDPVSLTATPDANSTFAGWNPSPCAASFTMPANNLTCTAIFNLSQVTPPDLVVTSVTSPSSGVVGGQINTAMTVKNQGGQTAGAFWAVFYLSPDANIALSDVSTGYGCPIPSLAAGASYSCAGAIPIPAAVSSGTYYLGAYVDVENAVVESSETNNGEAAANSITITGGVSYTLTVNKTGTGTGTVGGGGSFPYNTQVTPTATAATGSTFSGWSPGSCGSPFNLTADTTCTATFTLNTYTLTVNKTGTGNGTVGGAGTFPYGTSVKPTATAATGSTFAGWNPASCANAFNLTANTTCTATFTLNTYTLTVNKTGTGNGTVGGAGTFPYGTSVKPTAMAAAGSTFAGWSPGSCGSPFNLTANTTCTATFTRNTYTLTVNKTGTGTGTVGGGGTFPYGTSVKPTATAATGSTFSGWNPASCGSPFNLTANTTCAATFTLNTYTLTVNKTGTGTGTVGGGGTFPYGTSVKPTAMAAAGSTFAGWSPGSCGSPFNLTANTTCTATFTRNIYLVKTSVGPNGAISPTQQSVLHGATTTFTVTPATGYRIATVTGCNGALNSTTRVYTTGPITAACTVSATFNPVLTVIKSGSGGGLVTSSPAGIHCGLNCAAAFARNATVTLTATAYSGSIHVGWFNCPSNPTPQQCRVTMSAARSVAARFNTTTVGKTALTLYKVGPGLGTVTSTPVGITCGPTCPASVFNFATGATVLLTAVETTGSTFTGWSGCTVNPANRRQCTVVLNTGKVVSATFARPVLTVRKTGSGLVTSAPTGINCGSVCAAPYNLTNPVTTVTLTATPGTGFRFGSWVGCTPKPGVPQQCTVPMNQSRTVTASFIR